ncbi:MAG TPA: hypothetical protein VD913_05705 [bacterium]|nr:hypothetical protein [bacterium]
MAWRIGEILIQEKLISWNQLSESLDEQEKTREFIGEILVRKGFISKPLLYGALAKQHRMRFVDLDRIRINRHAIELIPRSIAQKYSIFPVDIQREILYLGVSSPLKIWPEVELIQMARVREIQAVLCLPDQIRKMIDEYYGISPSAKSFLKKDDL